MYYKETFSGKNTNCGHEIKHDFENKHGMLRKECNFFVLKKLFLL